MNDEREQALFEVLEPPTGGVRAFQRRIAVERRKRVRRRKVAAGAASLAVAALALFAAFGTPLPSRQAPAAELDFSLARMRLGAEALPSDAVTVAAQDRATTAALRLPSRDDRVVLYLVASSRPVEPESGDDDETRGANDG